MFTMSYATFPEGLSPFWRVGELAAFKCSCQIKRLGEVAADLDDSQFLKVAEVSFVTVQRLLQYRRIPR